MLEAELGRAAEENSLAVFMKEVLKGWRNSKRYLFIFSQFKNGMEQQVQLFFPAAAG